MGTVRASFSFSLRSFKSYVNFTNSSFFDSHDFTNPMFCEQQNLLNYKFSFCGLFLNFFISGFSSDEAIIVFFSVVLLLVFLLDFFNFKILIFTLLFSLAYKFIFQVFQRNVFVFIFYFLNFSCSFIGSFFEILGHFAENFY